MGSPLCAAALRAQLGGVWLGLGFRLLLRCGAPSARLRPGESCLCVVIVEDIMASDGLSGGPGMGVVGPDTVVTWQQSTASSSSSSSSPPSSSSSSQPSTQPSSSSKKQQGSQPEPCVRPADQLPVLAGLDDALQQLEELAVWPWKHAGALHELGFGVQQGVTGILLKGPPGCGKTLLVRHLAHKHGLPLLALDTRSVFYVSGDLGAAEATLRRAWARAHTLMLGFPTIIATAAATSRRRRTRTTATTTCSSVA